MQAPSALPKEEKMLVEPSLADKQEPGITREGIASSLCSGLKGGFKGFVKLLSSPL